MTPVYRFGSVELQPNRRRLLVDGLPVELGHRAFDVLLALVERAGQLVTKDELLGLVWPDLVVEENNLQVQVYSLRKILGTAAIATAPGRGYRFTLEVTPGGELSSPPVAQRHNLPAQATTFLGREKHVAEVLQLLQGAKLVTLAGVGGVGKTRLALQAAAEASTDYADGAWLVELPRFATPPLWAKPLQTRSKRHGSPESLSSKACSPGWVGVSFSWCSTIANT